MIPDESDFNSTKFLQIVICIGRQAENDRSRNSVGKIESCVEHHLMHTTRRYCLQLFLTMMKNLH